jgi:toxin FitB
MYLLDTNVFSELRKDAKADPRVLAWAASVRADSVFLSVLVIGEIEQGIARIARQDPQRAAVYEAWLARLEQEHKGRILGITRTIAKVWGPLNAPDQLPTVDGLLAATALVHDLTLVTRNVRDVARTGVKLLNPFDG